MSEEDYDENDQEESVTAPQNRKKRSFTSVGDAPAASVSQGKRTGLFKAVKSSNPDAFDKITSEKEKKVNKGSRVIRQAEDESFFNDKMQALESNPVKDAIVRL